MIASVLEEDAVLLSAKPNRWPLYVPKPLCVALACPDQTMRLAIVYGS